MAKLVASESGLLVMVVEEEEGWEIIQGNADRFACVRPLEDCGLLNYARKTRLRLLSLRQHSCDLLAVGMPKQAARQGPASRRARAASRLVCLEQHRDSPRGATRRSTCFLGCDEAARPGRHRATRVEAEKPSNQKESSCVLN